MTRYGYDYDEDDEYLDREREEERMHAGTCVRRYCQELDLLTKWRINPFYGIITIGFWIVVGDDEFTEFRAFFLRQRIIPAKSQNVIILVELSNEGTVVVGDYDIALALGKHLPQTDVEMADATDSSNVARYTVNLFSRDIGRIRID